jgi:hypothetical protein
VWVALDAGLAAGEERLALFPMTYLDGRRRRVFAGTVPVGARERYEGALPPAPIVGTSDPAAVLALPGRDRLESIVQALESLLALAGEYPSDAGQRATFDRIFREATFFALVDLAGFLSAELPAVWDDSVATYHGRALADLLKTTSFRTAAGPPSWMDALHTAHANRHLVLADLIEPPAPVTGVSVSAVASGIGRLRPTNPDAAPRRLFTRVSSALTEAAAATPPPPPPADGDAEPPPQPSRRDGAVYVARLVYERPRCAAPKRVTISEPTEPFKLAHFYDPDAPFRHNRIVLPVDTSFEGLRKFPRAVKMDLSAQLRRQVERVQAIKLQALDDGDVPGESPTDLGLVCSLSIPIITICALILLMIIVTLLNIVFFWVPLFKICLPKAGD